MSKSFYEKINPLLFVQYESEHVMQLKHGTLNVSAMYLNADKSVTKRLFVEN